MLNQVQTDLSANSENGRPMTDKIVFTAISGFSQELNRRGQTSGARQSPIRNAARWQFQM